MYVFFSGEGASDFGVCDMGVQHQYCMGDYYLPGPLTYIVDAMIEIKYKYSIIESNVAVFVDGAELERIKIQIKPSKKSIRLRGYNVPAETRFHFEDARSFAFAVSDFVAEKNENKFIAILFRDSNTNDNKEWQNKRNSMLSGFEVGFSKRQISNNGIPMLPRPVSEAWLLCAIYRQENQNTNCDYLEEIKHGGKSEHALKIQLEEKIGQSITRELLNEYVKTGKITYTNINLPGFNDFQQRLTEKL